MKKLGRDASLHPATVVAISEGAIRRQRRTRAAPESPPAVALLQVHPGIWKTALRLAEGDATRIRVISATRVEVA